MEQEEEKKGVVGWYKRNGKSTGIQFCFEILRETIEVQFYGESSASSSVLRS